MLNDIETAVKNHDEMVLRVAKLSDRLMEVSKERGQFMLAQDKLRGQISDFENFLNESRGVHDRAIIEIKSDITQRLDEAAAEIKDLSVDRRQLKAMVKNQNYHYTELQKDMGKQMNRLNQVEKICADVPDLIEYTKQTDNYLQNYLPTEVYTEIHRALYSSFE